MPLRPPSKKKPPSVVSVPTNVATLQAKAPSAFAYYLSDVPHPSITLYPSTQLYPGGI